MDLRDVSDIVKNTETSTPAWDPTLHSSPHPVTLPKAITIQCLYILWPYFRRRNTYTMYN